MPDGGGGEEFPCLLDGRRIARLELHLVLGREHPEAVEHETADVEQLPPCNYRVTPMTANFGLVTPGTTKDLPITITNLGTAAGDKCFLSGIDLAAGSHPAYSIVGGPVAEKELLPQDDWLKKLAPMTAASEP